MSGPPSSSLMLIAFRNAGNVPLISLLQVTCAKVAPVVPLSAPCDLVPWCIFFSEVMRVSPGGTLVP